MQDRISIVIPLYKVEKRYVEKCVKSFLSQSYTNIEIIIVDDGTPDDGGAYCDTLADDYPNVHVIHQKNSGVSVARNKGIAAATGEWIMFAEPDDYVESDILKRLRSVAHSETDIIICCCQVLINWEKTQNSFFKEDKKFVTDEEKRDLYMQLMDPGHCQPQKCYTAIGVPWGKIYRRSFLIENQLEFDPNLRRMQDNVFNMYAFHAARQIQYIDEPLYVYRYDHMVAIASPYDKNIVKTNINIIKCRRKCMLSIGLSNDKELENRRLKEGFSKLKTLLKLGLLHPDYNGSRSERNRVLKKVIESHTVSVLLQEINKKNVLTSATDKLALFLVQHRMFDILKYIWMMKGTK